MSDLDTLLLDLSSHIAAVSSIKALSNYDKFLESLLEGKHPPYCELVWSGEAFSIVLQLHFQKALVTSDRSSPEDKIYRQAAWSQFSQIAPAEQKLLSIRVVIRNSLPVTAEVTIKPDTA